MDKGKGPVIKILLGVALAISCIPAFAQQLWKGANYGMSVSEVQAVFPEATLPGSPGTLGSGAQEGLIVRDIPINSLRFDAHFYFKDQRLTQVTLGVVDGTEDSAVTVGYNGVLESLRAKYGQELSSENEGGVMPIRSATWLSGQANVTLFSSVMRGTPPILNIVYQTRLTQSTENL